MLNTYLQQVTRLIGDYQMVKVPTADLIFWINEGRKQIAIESQAVRANYMVYTAVGQEVYPFSAIPATISYATNADGPAGQNALSFANTNYVPTQAVVSGTNIPAGTFVTVVNGANDQGATNGQVILSQNLASDVPSGTTITFTLPGYGSIYAVGSISLIWGTFQYALTRMSFAKYQAQVRVYTQGYQYVPAAAAQYGWGEAGSLYQYPIANDVYQEQWDCYCVPIDLAADSDAEALPYPWTDAVQFYAAYMALNSLMDTDNDKLLLGRMKQADRMFGLWERYVKRARAFSQPGYVTNWYGRL